MAARRLAQERNDAVIVERRGTVLKYRHPEEFFPARFFDRIEVRKYTMQLLKTWIREYWCVRNHSQRR